MNSVLFVGRSRELELIRDSVEAGDLAFVEGEPGMGKTSLLRRACAGQECGRLTLYGRFSQSPGTPYEGIAAALEEHCLYLVGLAEAELGPWRDKARALISGHYEALEPAFPQWIRFAEAQPDPVPWRGTPTEARRLVLIALSSWLEAWSGAGVPTLLVIDDLQWADQASLALFYHLAAQRFPGLGFIGARRAETDGVDPVELPRELAVRRILLGPLGREEVDEAIELSFPSLEPVAARLLADRAFGTTGGHPLYLARWIQALLDSGQLGYDEGRAEWKLARPFDITDSAPSQVLPFLREQFAKVESTAAEILARASILDERFSADELAAVAEWPREDCDRALELGAAHRILRREDWGMWSFVHDNLRTAAESRLPREALGRLHALAGELYRGAWEREGADGALLLAARHLSLAWDEGREESDRRRLAELNREAGKRAQAGGAFAAAWSRLDFASRLTTPEDWEERYAETLALTGEAAEAAFLGGPADRRDALVGEIFGRARAFPDRAKAYEVRIQAMIAENRLTEAADLCIEVVEGMGRNVAASVEDLDPREVVEIRAALRRWARRGRRLPELRDERLIALIKIVVTGTAAVFLARPRRYAPLMHAAVGLLLPWRPQPVAQFLILAFASAQCGWLGDVRGGLAMNRIAWKLHRRDAGRAIRAKFILIYGNNLSHWDSSPAKTIALLEEGMEVGRREGDFEYASLAAGNRSLFLAYSMRQLDLVDRLCRETDDFVRGLRQGRGIVTALRQHQLVHNLRRPLPYPPDELRGPYYDEDVAIPLLRRSGDMSGLATTWTHKILLACAALRYDRAWEYVRSSQSDIDGTQAQIVRNVYCRMRLLTAFSLWPRLSRGEREAELPFIEEAFKDIRLHAEFNPREHGLRLAFLSLERDRALGREKDPGRRYRRLERRMAPTDNWLDLGLLRERHAAWLEEIGRPEEALIQWRAAREAFSSWGAEALVRALETAKPCLKPSSASSPSLQALMDAGRLISEEIDLGRLVQSAIRLLADFTGADYGYLRYEGPESPVGAEAWREGGTIRTSLSEAPRPASFALYRRASLGYGKGEEPLVIDDLGRESPFSPQSAAGARSALWLPIRHHGKPLGGALLENSETSGLFTPERVRVAGLLASQAAVSLENATLHRIRTGLAREREGMLRSEKLASLGILTAQVAHEVNNPNHAIRMNASAIKGLARDIEGQKELSGAIAEAAAAVEEASARIHRITSELKERLGAAGEVGPVDLNEVAESAFRLSEAYWSGFSRDLGLDLERPLPPVRGDFGKLRQALQNLVENACQALESSDAPVRIRTRSEPGALILEVEDGGRGIEPGLLQKVREPFFTTRRDSGGTGLGLHIVETIAREHGAGLSIKSEPGKGTKIALRFPA